MKMKKVFSVFACALLLAGSSALLVSKNAPIYQEAKATTDEVTLTLAESKSGSNKAGEFNMYAPANDIPYKEDWSAQYYPTQASCIKVNGVDKSDRAYPSSTAWNLVLKKITETRYYFDISRMVTKGYYQDGDTITIGGVWSGEVDAVVYSFTVTEFSVTWNINGNNEWSSVVNELDLEDYDVITLRDAGIFNIEKKVINTEDTDRSTNTWVPREGNTNYNFEFSFELQTYTANPDEFCLRIGSSNCWDVGETLRFKAYGDYSTLQEYNGGNIVWESGEVPHSFDNTTTLITIGNIRLKSGTQQVTYLKYNGDVKLYVVHSVAAAGFKGHIGFYHNANDCSIRNTVEEDFYALNGQVAYEGQITGGAPNGLYFSLPANDAHFINESWDIKYQPVDEMNILLNGQPFYGYGKEAVVKYTANWYYLRLSDYGYNSLINDGDILTIRGHFRNVTAGVMYDLFIAPASFKRVGSDWILYDFGYMDASSADNLEAGSLLTNIGATDPANRNKTAVKNFDQGITWDSTLEQEVSTLVYKKDKNGHTGVYFTKTGAAADSEFRVYFPGNGYKTESKGYAITQFTFDYIYKNNNVVGANNRNPGLTSDGYFVAAPAEGTVSNNFTVQALLHNNAKNMYYDIEVELVNDGNLHSVTVNLAYGDVMGFGFKVWDFQGEFFMSNVHADYQEYNANLDAMYGLLKMYDSENDGGYTSCADYYDAAKAGYLALSEGEKALFNTNAAYGSARARLAAWAVANGETFDAANGTFSAARTNPMVNVIENNSTFIIVIVAGTIALIAVASIFVLRRKH